MLVVHQAHAPTPQEFRQPRGTRACQDSIENKFLGMEFRVRLDFVDAIRRSVPLMRKSADKGEVVRRKSLVLPAPL
jgi:hypothetical protein